MIRYLLQVSICLSIYSVITGCTKEEPLPTTVSSEKMQAIYEEVKTPYKYGLVIAPETDSLKMDCPTVFRENDRWYMAYLVFDGRGYETWLAGSDDLLHWNTLGKVLPFSDSTDWDANQAAGYPALQDPAWGGSYELHTYQDKYWMTYLGGSGKGYEQGLLSAGMAYTDQSPSIAHEWLRLEEPILMAADSTVRWYDNSTIYKNWVMEDKEQLTGHPFVMYYNARGDSIHPAQGAERISMAVSDNMVDWQRLGDAPLINHHKGISGDAVLQKINDIWVMFYFGAFWPTREDHLAFNRFACSYDLVHWTEWEGDDLIAPSEPYDDLFAHKSWVLKHDGVVYHFYCAVTKDQDRGIAVATSKDMGQSAIHFIRSETPVESN
ncbi:MAG: glycosylase [Saprospiraceae bacterium]|nr:glycosylase [Lewinella sp.]